MSQSLDIRDLRKMDLSPSEIISNVNHLWTFDQIAQEPYKKYTSLLKNLEQKKLEGLPLSEKEVKI
jgi:hypothetical protein